MRVWLVVIIVVMRADYWCYRGCEIVTPIPPTVIIGKSARPIGGSKSPLPKTIGAPGPEDYRADLDTIRPTGQTHIHYCGWPNRRVGSRPSVQKIRRRARYTDNLRPNSG